jgi:glycosyltransferase involved in cell wall biosynthesis
MAMKILLLNQFFYPDVASTAQHATDLARRLARRGDEVTVVASQRSYADPRVRFAAEELWEGVRILRVPQTWMGKGSRWRRATDFASFMAACAWRLLWMPRFDVVVAMTTPPLISFLAALFVRLKGGALHLWLMDLNPDQAVAIGWLGAGSLVHRFLEACLRFSLQTAVQVIALDRFMKQRLLDKGVAPEKIQILPPWTHDDAVRYDEAGRRHFRQQHGLEGKFVVMYSGNHSPCHPLDTLLAAARRLQERQDIVFCFVGGGSEFVKVRRSGLRNVVSLPYQPLDQLGASLSAADLHVVVMGEPFVGIVHPCKIYNIMRLGIPVLYIGPAEGHITDLIPPEAIGVWAHRFGHGDVEGVAACIAKCAESPLRRSAEAMRLAAGFSEAALAPKLVELLVRGSEVSLTEVPAYAGH